MDFVTLHRSDQRHAFFHEHQAASFFYAEAIQSWVLTSAADIKAVLSLPNTRAGTADAPAAYERLARDRGRPFPNIQLALSHIPLCWEGDEHTRLRRALADFLVSRRVQMAGRATEMARGLAQGFDGRTEVDLVQAFVDPLVGSFLGELLQIELEDWSPILGTTAIFDRMIGLRRRREIDDQLGTIRQAIRSSLGEDPPEAEVGRRVALFILGTDVTRAALAESLYQLLLTNPGSRLSDLPYPAVPNETGVPIVERIVEEPFEYRGHLFSRGERIRAFMQSLAYSDNAPDRLRMFGIGPHSCLGRQVSLDLWKAITETLARSASVPTIRDYVVRTDDYTFLMPHRFVVEMRNDP